MISILCFYLFVSRIVMVHDTGDSGFCYQMMVSLYFQSTVHYMFTSNNEVVLCIDSIISLKY